MKTQGIFALLAFALIEAALAAKTDDHWDKPQPGFDYNLFLRSLGQASLAVRLLHQSQPRDSAEQGFRWIHKPC